MVVLIILLPIESEKDVDNKDDSSIESSEERLEDVEVETGILIPSSRPGDKGVYYLMNYEKVEDNIKSLHKRVGVDSVGYTIVETNCKIMQVRVLGYSEESPSKIIEESSDWFELVDGSSKSDLANFLCVNYY